MYPLYPKLSGIHSVSSVSSPSQLHNNTMLCLLTAPVSLQLLIEAGCLVLWPPSSPALPRRVAARVRAYASAGAGVKAAAGAARTPSPVWIGCMGGVLRRRHLEALEVAVAVDPSLSWDFNIFTCISFFIPGAGARAIRSGLRARVISPEGSINQRKEEGKVVQKGGVR